MPGRLIRKPPSSSDPPVGSPGWNCETAFSPSIFAPAGSTSTAPVASFTRKRTLRVFDATVSEPLCVSCVRRPWGSVFQTVSSHSRTTDIA